MSWKWDLCYECTPSVPKYKILYLGKVILYLGTEGVVCKRLKWEVRYLWKNKFCRKAYVTWNGEMPYLYKTHVGFYVLSPHNFLHGTYSDLGQTLTFKLLSLYKHYLSCLWCYINFKLEIYWKQACMGLCEIHAKKYLHGDIKPENMLVIDSKLIINDFDSSCSKDIVCTKRQKR